MFWFFDSIIVIHQLKNYEKMWMYFINPIHHRTLKVNHIFKLIFLKSIITCTYYKFKLSFTSMVIIFQIFQVGLVTRIPMPKGCNNKWWRFLWDNIFFRKTLLQLTTQLYYLGLDMAIFILFYSKKWQRKLQNHEFSCFLYFSEKKITKLWKFAIKKHHSHIELKRELHPNYSLQAIAAVWVTL
jgi:hypothetical protein